jgi:prophage regulatory protein
MPKLLRLPQVIERTNLRRSTLYELMSRDEFPRPVKITGARLNTWLEDEIDRFIARRIADREGA